MTTFTNEPSRDFIEDQSLVSKAQMRADAAARHAREVAAEAKALADAEARKEREIAEAAERAGNYAAAQAAKQGRSRFSIQNGTEKHEDLSTQRHLGRGMVAPQTVIDQTPIVMGGVHIGPEQAKELVAQGVFSKADYFKGLSDALGQHGYSPPPSLDPSFR